MYLSDFATEVDGDDPVKYLQQADSQVFTGYESYASIYEDTIIDKILSLSRYLEKNVLPDLQPLTHELQNIVVFSGCGTSGRIAYLCSRNYNQKLKRKITNYFDAFYYTISGGDTSILESQELPEDDPEAGVKDLIAIERFVEEQIGRKVNKVVIVGISCGLSAPYVMGQIHHALLNIDRYMPVLIGFNPVNFARSVKIEKCNFTCREVVEKMAVTSGGILINPIIGPEPITGSSRMKGGTTTKILLDVIVNLAIQSKYDKTRIEKNRSIIVREMLEKSELTFRRSYYPISEIAQVLSSASESLRKGGNLYYFGMDTAAILGIIDASEMFDTYGLSPHTVRAFVSEGWKYLSNREGDLSKKGPIFQITFENFFENVFPTANDHDTVVIVSIDILERHWADLVSRLRKKIRNIHLLQVSTAYVKTSEDIFSTTIHVTLPTLGFDKDDTAFAESSVKYILNAITTGACISKGLVFKNKMINMGISNNKLYYRAIQIIQSLANEHDAAKVERNLLKAIYNVDDITESILQLPISQHIIVATPKSNILPISLILTMCKGTKVEEAKQQLAKEPIIRTIISKNS